MAALQGVRVLVVENDEMNAMLLEMQLTQAGALVIGPASTIDQALQLVKDDNPELAVLDYRLGDGQTSEPIAKLLSQLGVPFVLATGIAHEAVPATFGPGVILTKPYLAEDLVRSLNDARGKASADT